MQGTIPRIRLTETVTLPASVVLLLATCIFLLSCEREILGLDPPISADGYEIRGVVTDGLGNPIFGVNIRVDYDLYLEDANNPPAKTYTVSPPSEVIQVLIRTWEGVVFRSFAPQSQPAGEFVFTWDELAPSGQPAPSGLYFVTYNVGGTQVHGYNVIVRNTIVTESDSSGRFTIPNENLPIDAYPAPLFSSSGTFLGNYRVGDRVHMSFNSVFGTTFASVLVKRGEVTQLHAQY